MHCNFRQSDAAQSLCALISSPVTSSKSLSLSVAVLERFYCVYVTLRCDLLWPRDLDLWPLTLNICSVPAVPYSQTLYEIWAQSGNLQRSYGSLNFDLMTLNMYHVLRYALRYFTQSLISVKVSVHEIWRFFTLIRYDLDLWPVVIDLVARDHSLYWIWSKSDNPRLSYSQFCKFCSRYVSLWPWPLSPWPWSFVVVRASCVQTL